MADLGTWLTGGYAVPGEAPEESETLLDDDAHER